MNTVTDGAVTIDSNDSADAIRAELATEKIVPGGKRLTEQQDVPAKAQADGDAGDEPEPGEQTEADAAAASQAGKDLRKRKGSYQARINELTAAHYDTVRERDAAREEIAKLQKALDDAKKGPAEPAAAGGVKLDAPKFPKYGDWLETAPKDANDLEDWVEARDEWKAAKAKEATKTVEAETVGRREHIEKFHASEPAKQFAERMKVVLAEDPKFYDKVDPRLLENDAMSALPPGVQPTFANFLVEQVLQSEHPHKLMLWLSDPDNSSRLVRLKPEGVIREITKAELSFGSTAARTGPAEGEHVEGDPDDAPIRRGSRPAADEPERSHAAPPIKPVRGSSQLSNADEEPGDDDSDDAWLAWQQRQKRRTAS